MATACHHPVSVSDGLPNRSLSLIEEILNNYRSIECEACAKHIAFQLRQNPKIFLCSAKCLSSLTTATSHQDVTFASAPLLVATNGLSQVDPAPMTANGHLNNLDVSNTTVKSEGVRNVPNTMDPEVSKVNLIESNGSCSSLKEQLRMGPYDQQKRYEELHKQFMDASKSTTRILKRPENQQQGPSNRSNLISDSKQKGVEKPLSFASVVNGSNGPKEPKEVKSDHAEEDAANFQDSASEKGSQRRYPFGPDKKEFKNRRDRKNNGQSDKSDYDERRSRSKQDPQNDNDGTFDQESKSRKKSGESSTAKPHPLEPRAGWDSKWNKGNKRNLRGPRNDFREPEDLNANWRVLPSRVQRTNNDNSVEPKSFMVDLKLSESLKNGSSCIISFVWTPARVTVQATDDLERIREMQESISQYCESAPPYTGIPLVGQLILAPYCSLFYRAVVKRVSKVTGEVQVAFIDCGDEITVGFTDCVEIPLTIVKKYPTFGAEFNLTGVTAEGLAREDALKKLANAAETLDFILEIESEQNGAWSGALRIKDTDSTWNTLVQELLSSAPEPLMSPSEASSSQAKLPRQRFLQDLHLSPSFQNSTMVTIQFMWSNSKLTLVAQEDAAKLQQLAAAIENRVKKAQPMSRAPVPQEILLAPYSDGVYYRALVKEVTGDNATVEFIDFGDGRTVPQSELRTLNEDIIQHPLYGLTWVMSDLPKEVNNIPIDELKAFSESEAVAQIEVENCTDTEWSGRLWISQTDSWNQIALDALKAAAATSS